jgi:outer membrane receptor protein involved in Fe transport
MEDFSMRLKRVGLLLALALYGAAGIAAAQSTTATIRGHVADAQGLALPGVTISVTSPNLQGTRVTVSSENGDYVLNLLPSGTYTLTFELTGFQRQQRTVSLAPTQDLPVEVTLGPAAISEEVSVVGRAADVLTNTAQVATNFKQQLIADLPTTRSIDAYLLMAPAVHPTGPSGAYSIAGSTSFENLFMVNGVTVNENLRGQANDLYIEDAIQEATVATGGISAEYGRFSGGVVNVVTKSGGNLYQGTFRETMFNDQWRALTPFETTAIAGGATDARKQCEVSNINCVVPTHEYTFGGPIMKDRLWFFTAGRIQTRTEGRQLVQTNIAYTYERPTRRYEGKGTFSVNANHRFQGAYTKIIDKQINNTFSTNASMDLNSLNNRETPQDLYVVSYSGVLSSKLFVEGLFSKRHFSFIGDGATSTDPINGTLMIDNSNGRRYWSPTFCGVCDPERRDNQDFFGKATYFLSTSRSGSHNMTFGGDSFNDIRFANNHQSGSDYRILGTGTIMRGTGTSAVLYPVLLGNGTTIIQWNPIPFSSQGANFRTYSAFYNDSWRVNNRLTTNLGVRWDKNHGEDQQGNLVAKDAAFSPRFGVIIDPVGDGKWSVTASFAQYTAALSNSIADSASAGGNPQTFRFVYRGPDVNADANAASLTGTPDAIRQVIAWYNANGGSTLPLERNPSIPGVTPQIRGDLKSPNVLEYATGVNRQFGNRAAARVDYVYRDYRDLYVERRDLSTGKVTNSAGQTFDLGLIENTNDLRRRYSGVTTQGTYRVGSRTDAGATYTLSRAWGNFNGENVSSGPITADTLTYPEYRQASWNYPIGDLQIDQRHRTRLWLNYGVPRVSGLIVSFLETLESGVPFGANNLNNTSANGVDPRPYVTNPGYVAPPTGSTVNYFFTADCSRLPSTIPSQIDCVGGQRDGFRTQGQKRTDFAASYTYGVKAGAHTFDLFVQAQIINLFGQSQLCGCGDTVFVNGGSVTQTRIDQTVRTNVSNPSSYAAFNPFTTTPVQGVNWDYAPSFGTALNRFAYTTPRQFRITFGVRF